MKKFIITQLNALQDYKVEMRQAKRDNAQEGLKVASDDISSLVEAFNDIVAKKPELKQTVEPLIKQVRKTGRSVKTAISEQKKALEDFTRKENIYMSIMSLFVPPLIRYVIGWSSSIDIIPILKRKNCSYSILKRCMNASKYSTV